MQPDTLTQMIEERRSDAEFLEFCSESISQHFSIRQQLFYAPRHNVMARLLQDHVESGRLEAVPDNHLHDWLGFMLQAGRHALVRAAVNSLSQQRRDTPGFYLTLALLDAIERDGLSAVERCQLSIDQAGDHHRLKLQALYTMGWCQHHLLNDVSGSTDTAARFELEMVTQLLQQRPPVPPLTGAKVSNPSGAAIPAALTLMQALQPSAVRYLRPSDIAEGIEQPDLRVTLQAAVDCHWLADFIADTGSLSAALETRRRCPSAVFSRQLLDFASRYDKFFARSWMRDNITSKGCSYAWSPFAATIISSAFATQLPPAVQNIAQFFWHDDEFFVVILTDFMIEEKCALFLPRLGLVISLHAEWFPQRGVVENTVNALLHWSRSAPEALEQALVRHAQPVLAIGFQRAPGHNFSNDFGAGQYIASRPRKNAVRMALDLGHDYFGYRQLLLANGIDVLNCSGMTAQQMWELGQDMGIVPYRFAEEGAYFEARNTLRRRLEPRMARESKASGGRFACLMLRQTRRIWKSQFQGILRAIKLLGTEFEFTDFILDGVTRLEPNNPAEGQAVRAEQGMAQAIAEAVAAAHPELSVRSIIGKTFTEKLMLSESVELIICPKGSGFVPLYAYLSDCPAILHGNTRDLRTSFYDVNVMSGARHPITVDRHLIQDLDSSADGSVLEGDYEIDPDDMVSFLRTAMLHI